MCKEFKEKGYKFKSNGNSIHSEDAIRFTKEYFQVDDWTMQTLENGCKAEVRGRVPDYKEENNKSTMSDLETFRKQIEKWDKWFPEQVKNPPNLYLITSCIKQER